MRFIYSRTRTLTAKDMFDAMMDEACSRSMLMRHFCSWAPSPPANHAMQCSSRPQPEASFVLSGFGIRYISLNNYMIRHLLPGINNKKPGTSLPSAPCTPACPWRQRRPKQRQHRIHTHLLLMIDHHGCQFRCIWNRTGLAGAIRNVFLTCCCISVTTGGGSRVSARRRGVGEAPARWMPRAAGTLYEKWRRDRHGCMHAAGSRRSPQLWCTAVERVLGVFGRRIGVALHLDE
jgi:hypothetical protein